MKYRPEIDGLRTIAVLPVVFFHCGVPWLGGGYVGVDVFFVISGYLITSIIMLEEREGRFSYARFYERRARRILPPLFLVMLCCLPFAWAWMLPRDMKAFCSSLAAVAASASNFLFWRTTDYFDTASELKPLLHTWSLAVEEQYYLVFPVVALWLLRAGNRWLMPMLGVVALASFGAAQWTVASNQAFAYFLLPTRAWELMVGALTAVYLLRRKSPARYAEAGSLAGLLAIVVAIGCYTPRTPAPSVYTALPVLGSALVILFASPRNLVGRLLSQRALVGVGLISYGIYVWHQPLLALVRLRDTSTPGLLSLVLVASLSIPLAWISWRFVEQPFRARARWSAHAIAGLAVAGSLGFFVVGVVGYLTGGFPSRAPREVTDLSESRGRYFGLRDDAACNLVGADDRLLGCTKGAAATVPSVALIGDSQAASLAHALGETLAPLGRSVVQYTKTGCFPSADDARFDFNCGRFVRAASRDAVVRLVGTVVFYSVWAVPPEPGAAATDLATSTVFDAYKQSIQDLLALGKQVIVVYPTPEPGYDVPVRMARQLWFGVPRDDADDMTTVAFAAQSSASYRSLDALGDAPNLIRIYPGKLLCDTFRAGRCVTSRAGKPLYADHRHLSDEGQRLLATRIERALAKN